jgi:pyruvate/2-oxoglutarate dehydrogenase complex dihydrolipoamide dehydrogenase (E3) component
MAEKFNAIIIGTGQAGKPLALALAEKGWKTAVIESKYVGGSCINYGCTPTKSLIASAKAAYMAQNGGVFGVKTGSVKIDFKKVIARKNKIVRDFRKGSESSLLKNKNIELIYGTASFISPYEINVELKNKSNRVLESQKIFINTGVKPAIPEIEGIDNINYYTSKSLLNAKKLPEHLVIIGGGYIGLEFGQVFKRFGSKVTIIQQGNKLFGREDDDVADEMYNILTKEGIKIHLNAKTKRITKKKNGIVLDVSLPNGNKKIKGSHILIAAGVKPNIDLLKLNAGGIETDGKGFIKTSDRLETNVNGIYALGDVKGGPAFTHISYDDYRIVKANLLEGDNKTIRGRLVPYTVFTDPQLGRVGLTENEAKKNNIKCKIFKMPMSYSARAVETSETNGFMKAVTDEDTKQILGCAILGSDGGELMSMIEIAMMSNLPYTELKNAIFAHPLLAESLNTLFTQK